MVGVDSAALSYENMVSHAVTGRMYRITPSKIKIFHGVLFPVEDGLESVLDLGCAA